MHWASSLVPEVLCCTRLKSCMTKSSHLLHKSSYISGTVASWGTAKMGSSIRCDRSDHCDIEALARGGGSDTDSRPKDAPFGWIEPPGADIRNTPNIEDHEDREGPGIWVFITGFEPKIREGQYLGRYERRSKNTRSVQCRLQWSRVEAKLPSWWGR
ncbi:hypothetical protein BJ508DRAFT_182232 [Ascobolus immersus RN42]|uniref:Uncharacterized protein n=1 Tax=Ascobolus immersus RN42 TaxID=1160509 RepID=A0A3N4HSB4_ASCIM|nr:hypothetical protein BJ508DRAFT_182232 [Ascobolus immersus RN42]